MNPSACSSSASASRRAAADWALRCTEGLTVAEQAELERWLAGDPARRGLLTEAERTLHALNRLRLPGQSDRAVLELARFDTARRVRRRRRALRVGGVLAAAIAFAALGWQPLREAASSAVPAVTVAVRPDERVLPDNSIVHLNAEAEIRVNYSATGREIDLLHGEALFSVAKDPARPFVVRAAGVEVRAVGTQFSVKAAGRQVELLVTEGRVAVARPAETTPAAPAEPASTPLMMQAGSRLRMELDAPIPLDPAVTAVTPKEIVDALAWREKRLEFTATPLGEAVRIFNRENRTQIVLADPAMEGWRIGGIFWKDNPRAFARLLQMTLPVAVTEDGDERIVLRARERG